MLSDLPNSQKGFTLIELMIAITLGLLISAAALMIFLSSQRSLAIQAGMGEIQQNTIFGLSALTYDLRHANLDTNSDYISLTGKGSGVIFESSQAMSGIDLKSEVTQVSTTQKGSMNEFSDQLVIQYKARQPMKDCEGTDVPKDAVVAQRYYIDELPANQQQGNTKRYGLRCDAAGSHGAEMSKGQQTIIPDAESFKVSFGTRDLNGTTGDRTDDKLRYQTLDAYKKGATGTTVVSIEVGIVMRSSNSVHSDNKINQSTFTIAGQPVTLASADNRHLRVALSQVVAVRNSQGLE